MPKQKTSKTTLKRFKITKKGKLLRRRQCARHKRLTKSRRQTRAYKIPVTLNSKQAKKIKRVLQGV